MAVSEQTLKGGQPTAAGPPDKEPQCPDQGGGYGLLFSVSCPWPVSVQHPLTGFRAVSRGVPQEGKWHAHSTTEAQRGWSWPVESVASQL